jgi:hypothetical protein
MTEEEWLTGTKPINMLEFLRDKTSDRKLRLFSVGCCRRLWRFLPENRGKRAVEVMELFIDGRTEDQERMEAGALCREAADEWCLSDVSYNELWRTLRTYRVVLSTVLGDIAQSAAIQSLNEAWRVEGIDRLIRDGTEQSNKQEIARLSSEILPLYSPLIHDIFGNPFRPITINPSWLTSTVLTLATGIYQEKAFDRMPILADALQDAGCDNEDILNHCREPGEHCRGCFVVDLLLEKA